MNVRWRCVGFGFWRLLWLRLTGRAGWRTHFWNEDDFEPRPPVVSITKRAAVTAPDPTPTERAGD